MIINARHFFGKVNVAFLMGFLFLIPSCSDMGQSNIGDRNQQPKNYQAINVINNLIQLDMDACYAYSQAIEAITHQHVREKLVSFQDDHERHIKTLSEEVLKLGGTPPTFNRDFKGFIISGYTAIKSTSGTIGALEAMDTNEIITRNRYEQAISTTMPSSTKKIILANFKDEKRHVQTIKKMLRQLKRRKY